MQLRKIRRRDRKLTLRVLYACEIGGFNAGDVVCGKVTVPDVEEIDDFAAQLIDGT